MKYEKCIVHGCTNHKHEGKFIGGLCAPCHLYLTTGKIGPTDSFLSRHSTLQIARDELLFASILLNKQVPLSPSHISAIQERLGYPSDRELLEAVRTGITTNSPDTTPKLDK